MIMNKKFSTLLAGVLLAGSVGAFAQGSLTWGSFTSGNTEELSAKKYYLVHTGSNEFMRVAQDPATGVFQFKAVANTDVTSLAMADSALWTIKASTVEASGFTRFQLVNKATGVVFGFDEDNAVVGDATAATAESKLIGGLTEWKWLDSRFANDLAVYKEFSIDFANGDSVMKVKKAADGVLYAVKDRKTKTVTGLSQGVFKPGSWIMGPADLNTKGEKNNAAGTVKYMQLSFGENGPADNKFADKYQAQTLYAAVTALGDYDKLIKTYEGYSLSATSTDPLFYKNYVSLNKVGDDGKLLNQYAHVDSSYFASTGETYAKYNKIALSDAVMEKNAAGQLTGKIDTLGRNLPTDAFFFKFTKNLMTDSIKIESLGSFAKLGAPVAALNGRVTGNANTGWMFSATNSQIAGATVATGVTAHPNYTVLSHCTLEGETTKVVTFYEDDASKPADNHVNLYATQNAVDPDYTSIPAGVYKMKDVKTEFFYGVHIYEADSTADWTGKAAIDNMNFDDMPAFQWVVVKNDLSSDARKAVSPVTITNREFPANEYKVVQLRKGTSENALIVKYTNGEEVEFIPVAEEAVKDKYLGYKNLTNEELEFTAYTFNYWHPYAQDRYIAKNAEDSILNVLTAAPARFEITGNAEKPYGYTPTTAAKAQIKDLAQLVRRSYTLKTDSKAVYVNAEDQFMVTDKAVAADEKAVFYFKENNEFKKAGELTCYYALIDTMGVDSKAGVRQNDEAALLLSEVLTEISTATFAIAEDNQPLYRRLNSTLEDEANEAGKDVPVYVKFKEQYVNDYLMDETNKNFQREGMNYLGIGAKNIAEAGLSFFVRPFNIDNARGEKAQYLSPRAAIKPQYLIYVSDEIVAAVDTIPCKESHKHYDVNAGAETDDPKKCFHATPGTAGFNRYKLLVSFADSVNKEVANTPEDKKLYTFGSYTRVGFVDAVEQDSVIYILGNAFAEVATKDLKMADVKKALEDKLISKVDLKDRVTKDEHNNYTWSFRYIDPANVDLANAVEEERSFLFESNKGNADVAPTEAAWLKNQNNCLVLSDPSESTFEEAKTGGDNALIFSIEKGSKDDMATDNETIATSEVTVIAGEGQVTIANAAGKKVVISNILGQVVANTVLTSDNATIAAPQGVVVVAVEGEEAVKAIIK